MITNTYKTASVGLFGYLSLNFDPANFRQNYTLDVRSQFTHLAARSLGAWFFLCMLLRCGAWHFWGEQGWYDACMVSLAVPLWHYSIEKLIWDSVEWKQVLAAYAVDGCGLLWMLIRRKEVLGSARLTDAR